MLLLEASVTGRKIGKNHLSFLLILKKGTLFKIKLEQSHVIKKK